MCFLTMLALAAQAETPPTLPAGVVAQGDHYVSTVDGAEMVYVPAGEFLRGGALKIDGTIIDTGVKPEGGSDFSASHVHVAGKSLFRNVPPAGRVLVKGFFIDKYEVSNRRYKKYLDATKQPVPTVHPAFRNQLFLYYIWRNNTWPIVASPAFDGADHPVVSITWDEAAAYAKWAGKQLPTELQWEKAARGADGREFPWGNDWNPSNLNTAERGERATRECGATANDKSPYGVMDLAGNVSEWTTDSWPDTPTLHVIKGGNWGYLGFIEARGWMRRSNGGECIGEPSPAEKSVTIGFRCVIPVP